SGISRRYGSQELIRLNAEVKRKGQSLLKDCSSYSKTACSKVSAQLQKLSRFLRITQPRFINAVRRIHYALMPSFIGLQNTVANGPNFAVGFKLTRHHEKFPWLPPVVAVEEGDDFSLAF